MELTTKYQENRKRIIEIVRKHFGYEDASKDLFESIYNDRMPSLDVEYQKLLTANNQPDFKVRRKLTDEVMEKLDCGFIMFKLYFSSFSKFYNITYQNFRDWKIEINKNMFKLQKALTNYYSDPKNHIHFSADCESQRDPEYFRRTEFTEAKISDKLRRIQEAVSERKLPKSNLELVLTFDFADWFLCSSGETWHSCLCLDSSFDACYWHGLPALMGDPNRCMVYLTDGTKKNFNGVETDKVIARMWGIMAEDGKIYLNKSYPTKNFSAKDVEFMFPEFKFGSLIDDLDARGTRRTSKNPITPFWMPDNYSDFIYSDLSTFTDDYKIVMGAIGGGHYVFCNRRNQISGASHFHYSNGLSELIKRNIDIIAIGGHRNLKKCAVCGSITAHQHRTDDGFICDECYAKLPQCSCCGNRAKKENMMEFEGKLYCRNCFNTRFAVCEICGKKALKEEFNSSEKNVCKVCHSKFYFKCGACSLSTRVDRLKMIKNKVYCSNCADEEKGDRK